MTLSFLTPIPLLGLWKVNLDWVENPVNWLKRHYSQTCWRFRRFAFWRLQCSSSRGGWD